MHVLYFQCYWPSNLLFLGRCVTYISNSRRIGQKLQSLSSAIGSSDGQKNSSSDFTSVQCHDKNCPKQKSNNTYVTYTYCL